MNILVTPIYFKLIITWSLSYGSDQQWNRHDTKMQANQRQFRLPCGCGGAMQDVGHITQWSTSRASLEATGCRHRTSSGVTLPRRQCNGSTRPMAASSGFEWGLSVLHRVMGPTSHRRILMAIEIASNLPAIFVVLHLLFAHNVS